MKYAADLHIHSRFSRATSKSLDLVQLDLWGRRKGLAVVGTGDASHPEWLAEMSERLQPAEPGLYRLKPEFSPGPGRTRFAISAEISSIYKQGGRVRKVHSLILLPNLESARELSRRLGRLGNVTSDGRPILGLSAKDLLALTLDASPDAFFIPAHIWTPWFSLLGSKSGFDSIEECFEDLSGHVHALETGLSSDPPMNWRLSSLDRYTLVSNSDAHSADKLGREANWFDADLSYPAMIAAMKGEGGFLGTVEFFPEEGKYHLDGHRKCGRRMEPEETMAAGGVCPVCGKPVTVGVMNRVLELADRPAGARPPDAPEYHSLIPLAEVLSELLQVGPKSKRVAAAYDTLLAEVGPELHVLQEAPPDRLAEVGGPALKLAVERMRAGNVRTAGGYDGEYGRVHLFEPGELDRIGGQMGLFGPAPAKRGPKKPRRPAAETQRKAESPPEPPSAPILAHTDPILDGLDPAQTEAVTAPAGPLVVLAGPGAGKTLVLTRRAAYLIRENLAAPDQVLGLTFTRQAAGEMAARLAALLPFRSSVRQAPVMTFHALGLLLLEEGLGQKPDVLDEDDRWAIIQRTAKQHELKPGPLLEVISRAKQDLLGPADVDAPWKEAWADYQKALADRQCFDFDDLTAEAARLLGDHPDLAAQYRRRWPAVLVDEYQDVNLAQYRLIRLLTGDGAPNLTVIGDPDQAIYTFRGADPAYFQRFVDDYPAARRVVLDRNYRSAKTIVRAAGQVIAQNPGHRPDWRSDIAGPAKIATAVLDTPAAEAEFVVRNIERLLGGSSHFALDSGRSGGVGDTDLSLADVAVLYRVHALAGPVAEALDRAGLPYQRAGRAEIRETDQLDFAAEKINLLTMHAAKGLEFDVVFLIGLEDHLLPYHPPDKDPADTAEERRLFFVALTRAQKRLFLTRSRSRTLYGRNREPEASPFLQEIEAGLKEIQALPQKKVKPKSTQLDLF